MKCSLIEIMNTSNFQVFMCPPKWNCFFRPWGETFFVIDLLSSKYDYAVSHMRYLAKSQWWVKGSRNAPREGPTAHLCIYIFVAYLKTPSSN